MIDFDEHAYATVTARKMEPQTVQAIHQALIFALEAGFSADKAISHIQEAANIHTEHNTGERS